LADGFIGGNVPLDEVAPLVNEMKVATEAAGRDFDTLHLVSRGTFRLHGSPQGENRRPLWGTLDEIKEDIRRYADAGLTELFLDPNFDPDVSLEQTLEVIEALAPGGIEL
jgi:alkanesulfonate monooxygenase SsuD/methylene tetrahydromethanopterin reductase-like flavin-dependent oxidoreductase (luciferase family)